ncbi:hypothetical protein EC968_002272 [Mortierella alpina]|nr:hypothetical protein EC968_002272 [Mortierella alpina]
MESGSIVHKFFSIHELVLSVSAHLSSPDLAQCTLVCKEWRRRFEPSLWTNFCPERSNFTKFMSTRPEVKAALIRNLGHIRTIGPFPIDGRVMKVLGHGLPQQHDESVKDPDRLCTNLRRIDFGSFSSGRFYVFAERLDTLLRHNHHLTHLEVSLEHLYFVEDSYPAISTLRHLQHLTVSSILECAQGDCILGLLRACLPLPELTELQFVDSDVLWDEGDHDPAIYTALLETIIKEATIDRFAQSPNAKKIKSMQFPGTIGYSWVPLPLLLLKSSLLDLERCEIPFFYQEVNPDEIELVVREHCPNLKHLKCSFSSGVYDQVVRAFIRGCSGLQSFTASFFLDVPELKPQSLLSELVSRHHTTLEEFELIDTGHVSSRQLQEVLTKCKHLKRFRATSSSREDARGTIVATDVYQSDWGCVDLRELNLVLNLRPDDTESFCDINLKEAPELIHDIDERKWPLIMMISTTDRGEVVEWYEDEVDSYKPLVVLVTKRIYIQIGRLEKLEELTLDIDRSNGTWQFTSDYEFNLTLSKGWLGKMAGLKKLRKLWLLADFWSAMGQAEVEFIYEHWPLLREIAFACDIAPIHAMPHWQWLLNKRPLLRFVSTCAEVVAEHSEVEIDFDSSDTESDSS